MQDNTPQLPWRVKSYLLEHPAQRAYGYVTFYPSHPQAAAGTPWAGYCSLSDLSGHVTIFDEWFTSDEAALRAVEAFVLNSTDDTNPKMERIFDR